MSVNSITGATAPYNVQTVKSSASEDKFARSQSLKSDPAPTDNKSNNADTKVVDLVTSSMQKASVIAANGSQESDQVVRRVVESYNQQGKLRTKYLDSKNNVVYQLPSETVLKMEEQVAKAEPPPKAK